VKITEQEHLHNYSQEIEELFLSRRESRTWDLWWRDKKIQLRRLNCALKSALVLRCCTSPFCRESRRCFICFSLDPCQYANKIALFYEPTTSFPLRLPRDHLNLKSLLLSPVQKAMHFQGLLQPYTVVLLCFATELLESYRKSGCRKCTFILAAHRIIRSTTRCMYEKTLRNT